ETHWEGQLSTSALSTATASVALYLYGSSPATNDPKRYLELASSGADWLARNANDDGGWGDTIRSVSNISTTTLCWATLSLLDSNGDRDAARERAASWIAERSGTLEPETLSRTIIDVYGEDRTFSVPILTMCALCGVLGEGRDAWKHVIPLPFELASLPQKTFQFLGLPVVSYALPALIAIGRVRHESRPSRNPIARITRTLTRGRTMRVLDAIQPTNGGFLEATPLTSFVAMSLIGAGLASHDVTRRCIEFLSQSAFDDGSWPIDTNLATWVTTLSINALADAGRLDELSSADRDAVGDWLLGQQYREVHPYTGAAPGAWAWTDLPGGVPDADDTPGALLALHHLGCDRPEFREAAARGISWLLDLQNRDGGVPTFCRGWGKLPFDRSGADLTAHTLRALHAWKDSLIDVTGAPTSDEMRRAAERMLAYLRDVQNSDGSWTPLWFGNQFAPENENRSYGTAKVLHGLQVLAADWPLAAEIKRRAEGWFVRIQNPDGGWGGQANVESSVEETALALDALARSDVEAGDAIRRGVEWLTTAIDESRHDAATPIGFYFANLWYFETLYPLTFAISGLGSVQRYAGDSLSFDPSSK
ncbi:MAG: prenyltransferase/squalene oxidase repeat-containing protein, partial [Planctomycetota bacterium]